MEPNNFFFYNVGNFHLGPRSSAAVALKERSKKESCGKVAKYRTRNFIDSR